MYFRLRLKKSHNSLIDKKFGIYFNRADIAGCRKEASNSLEAKNIHTNRNLSMLFIPTAQKIKSNFYDKEEYRIFLFCALIGFISSIITFKYLDGFPYEMGKNLIGVFIPPFTAIIYMTHTGSKHPLNKKVLLKTLVLYFIQITPFIPTFFQVFQPTPANDFARYYLYAKNMIDNNTLWGGDQLVYNKLGRGLVTQPGYRYFIFFELLIFRDLYRFVSFLNIALLISAMYSFQRVIQELVVSDKFRKALLLLVVLLTPFTIKNLLMGMPEWLTASVLMAFCYFLVVQKREIMAVFLLALAPFFRQNLVIASLLLLLYILLQSKKKLIVALVFFIVLLLPLYHNLNYSGEWKFFVDLLDYPFYTYTPDRQISGYNVELLVNNIVHYFGIEIFNGKIEVSFIAILFLPFSVIIFFLMFKYLPRPVERILYFIITMSVVGPAVLMANAYYPRFEFVNVIVMLVCFSILNLGGHKSISESRRVPAHIQTG